MDLSQRNVDVITVFAEDLQGTKAFYLDVLGLPKVFEDEHSAVFKFANIMINLLEVTNAPPLITPAKVAPADAGSRVMLSVFVDDVDAACAELAGHGVSLLNGPVDRPWGMRTAAFADPAGHVWEVAQDLDV